LFLQQPTCICGGSLSGSPTYFSWGVHVQKNNVSPVASLYVKQHPVTNKVYWFKGLYDFAVWPRLSMCGLTFSFH